MSLFKRACLVGVASLLIGGGLALSAPQITAAGGPTKCYEQVNQYTYKRETFRTEYKYVKETRERSRQNKNKPWGPWSAWTVWNNGSTTRWEGPGFSEEGDHDGNPNDDQTSYDRDYRYVSTGETRQVSTGFETTGWLTGPPAGSGWVQSGQQTVNGNQIPCSPKPEDKTEYTNWVDGGFECGATTVTQTRTKKVTTYALVNYQWVGSSNESTESQTRALTATEIQSCKPDDKQPTYTEWTDGTWECGDTTVTQTRTRTDYTWTNTGGSTWVEKATETTATQTRPLTDAEITSCKPDDKQPTYTEWTDSRWDCGAATVTQTRTRTDYTWTNTGGSTWEQTATETTETQTRPLTETELVKCNPPTKEPKVDRQDVGTPECGATTIQVEVTTTTYSYTYNPQTNAWDEASETAVTHETRDLGQDEQFPCPPTEFTPPTAAPVCGPDNDDVTVPADTEDIDYVDSGWVDNHRTITANWTYDGSELGSWTFTDDATTCPEETTTTTVPEETTTTTEPGLTTPTIAITALVPVCHNDAPYIDVSLSGDATFNGRAGTVTFKDADGNVVESHRITFQSGETLRFLYPGATVDAAGFATDWPGWKLEGTTWVPDSSDARLRDGLTVVVHVNPTATGTVAYPASTPACIPTPTGVSVDSPTTAPTTMAPSLEGFSLPETGTDTNMIVAISAALVLLGAGAVFATRSRKA